MQSIRNFILIFLSAACLFGCEKQLATPVYNEDPVIEGYLFANDIASIRITSQIAVIDAMSSAGEGIDSLQVYIDTDSGTHQLINTGNGIYQDSTLVLIERKQYHLHFQYRGKTVSATTTLPGLPRNFTQSVSEITLQKIDSTTTFTPGSFQMNDPIEIEWDNTDQSYFMIVVQNIESELELIRDTTNPRFQVANFRNEPSVADAYRLRDQQFQYFGTHMITLYHLNPDYAALYTGNSNSSQNLSNPTTNITNGLGIFTGISTDTLFLEVHKQ